MTEESVIIEMNIAHYEALLKLDLDDSKRSAVSRLLAEATEQLAYTNRLKDGNRIGLTLRSSTLPAQPFLRDGGRIGLDSKQIGTE